MGFEGEADKLQAFCSALEQAGHLLESAAAELSTVGKALADVDSDLSEALAGLESDAQSLEHELGTSARQAKDDVVELANAGHQALETRLPALEGHVSEAKTHLHQVLAERSTALESELNELATHAFEPFDTLLTGEQSAFERWTHEADVALGTLSEALESVANETSHDLQQAGADLQLVHDAVQQEHTEWQRALDDDNEHVGTELPGRVDRTFADLEASVPAWVNEWGERVETTVTADHNVLVGYGKDAAAMLTEESRHATDDVHTAGASLSEAGIEFEQTAADADAAEPQAREAAELRPRIETADAQVVEIRNVTDAMNNP